jgi:uncharacterized protein YbaR (Trm112 family)
MQKTNSVSHEEELRCIVCGGTENVERMFVCPKCAHVMRINYLQGKIDALKEIGELYSRKWKDWFNSLDEGENEHDPQE